MAPAVWASCFQFRGKNESSRFQSSSAALTVGTSQPYRAVLFLRQRVREGVRRAAETGRRRVPSRRMLADRLVVVMKLLQWERSEGAGSSRGCSHGQPGDSLGGDEWASQVRKENRFRYRNGSCGRRTRASSGTRVPLGWTVSQSGTSKPI